MIWTCRWGHSLAWADRRGRDAAGRGRRAVIADWARRVGVHAVALAHTRDDVAETFVMRLARGAGVDGLAAMAARWQEGGVTWLRPLLSATRAELREYLRGVGGDWVEDPSNDNPRFDRVRVRKALAVLAPLGITAERLGEVAAHLAEARTALDAVTEAAARRVLHDVAGAVRFDAAWAQESAEVQRRLVLRVIATIAPHDYGPRGPAVQALRERLLAGKPGVLAGCRFVVQRGQLWACREARAVAGLVCDQGQVWDGRWRLDGPKGGAGAGLGCWSGAVPRLAGGGCAARGPVGQPVIMAGRQPDCGTACRFWHGLQRQSAFPCDTFAGFGDNALNPPYECLSCSPMAILTMAACPHMARRIKEFVRG